MNRPVIAAVPSAWSTAAGECLDYQARHVSAEPTRAGEDHSLQPGTSAWAAFGATLTGPADEITDDTDGHGTLSDSSDTRPEIRENITSLWGTVGVIDRVALALPLVIYY